MTLTVKQFSCFQNWVFLYIDTTATCAQTLICHCDYFHCCGCKYKTNSGVDCYLIAIFLLPFDCADCLAPAPPSPLASLHLSFSSAELRAVLWTWRGVVRPGAPAKVKSETRRPNRRRRLPRAAKRPLQLECRLKDSRPPLWPQLNQSGFVRRKKTSSKSFEDGIALDIWNLGPLELVKPMRPWNCCDHKSQQ